MIDRFEFLNFPPTQLLADTLVHDHFTQWLFTDLLEASKYRAPQRLTMFAFLSAFTKYLYLQLDGLNRK